MVKNNPVYFGEWIILSRKLWFIGKLECGLMAGTGNFYENAR
jgi:hypothetical protein